MAISTAAVLYSFFEEVRSPKRDLRLWKCVGIAIQRPSALLAPTLATLGTNLSSTTKVITTRFKRVLYLLTSVFGANPPYCCDDCCGSVETVATNALLARYENNLRAEDCENRGKVARTRERIE
jgi:hypothetical protein